MQKIAIEQALLKANLTDQDLDAAFLGGGFILHLADEGAHGQLFRHGRGQAVHRHAQTGLAQHAVVVRSLLAFACGIGAVVAAQHLFNEGLCHVDGNAEADVVHGGGGIEAVAGILAGGDTL